MLFSLFLFEYHVGFYSRMPDDEKDEFRFSKKGIKELSFAQFVFLCVKVYIKIKQTLKTYEMESLTAGCFMQLNFK